MYVRTSPAPAAFMTRRPTDGRGMKASAVPAVQHPKSRSAPVEVFISLWWSFLPWVWWWCVFLTRGASRMRLKQRCGFRC